MEIICPVCKSDMSYHTDRFNNTSIVKCTKCWCHAHGGLSIEDIVKKLNYFKK
jgi:hypothetical protein